MSHLKRLRAPSFWRVKKKASTWVVKPSPGPHKAEESIPLLILLREILKIAETAKDAKKIIKRREIWVDGKPRRDPKFPVGLFDVIHIPKLNKFYRILPTKKGLEVFEIDEKDARVKICRIDGKTTVKKGKMQLNLHDGKNVLVEDPKTYKTGDSLLLELPTLKILKHIPLKPGNLGIVGKGKNCGRLGKVKKIIVTRTKEPTKVICESNGEELEVLKEHFFVIGEKQPLIKVFE